MSNITRFSVVMILFGVVMGLSLTARAANDPRFRYDNTLVKTINQDWSIDLYSEFDTDKDRTHDLNAIDQELTGVYSGFARWLDLGAGIGYWDAKGNGYWEGTTFPMGFATLKKTIFGLELSDRNRFEAEVPEHGEEGLVYRNALTIATAKKWTRFEIQPFVSNEIFYNFLAKYASDNQAFGGFNFKVTKNIGASLSFMMDSSHLREVNNGDHWKKTPMAILSTTVSF